MLRSEYEENLIGVGLISLNHKYVYCLHIYLLTLTYISFKTAKMVMHWIVLNIFKIPTGDDFIKHATRNSREIKSKCDELSGKKYDEFAKPTRTQFL